MLAAISWTHLELVTTTSFSPASKHRTRACTSQAQSGDRSQFLEEALSLQGVRMTRDIVASQSLYQSHYSALIFSSAGPGPGWLQRAEAESLLTRAQCACAVQSLLRLTGSQSSVVFVT